MWWNSDSDLEIAMLKDPPDLKAAAAFALLAGEARAALGQREAAIQMFQQAINMARVALDPMGEVTQTNIACSEHLTLAKTHKNVAGFGVQPARHRDDVAHSRRRHL
jgi:hypothetical protein